ncbi:MAG TPA: hypothetical protein VLG41_12705 [Hydrogenophaga sp.]|nr:hypothetical protein [Hydrogenophaga sp.]HSX93781.1 hypothetical protein [Hydrogenophaga sp.]
MIQTLEQLRSLYAAPGERAQRKQLAEATREGCLAQRAQERIPQKD